MVEEKDKDKIEINNNYNNILKDIFSQNQDEKIKIKVDIKNYVKIGSIFHHINNTICPLRISTSFLKKELENQLKEEISINPNIPTRDLIKYQQRKEEIEFFDIIFKDITQFIKHPINSLELSEILQEEKEIITHKKPFKEVYIEDYTPVKNLKFNLINKFNYLLHEYSNIKKNFGDYSSDKLIMHKDYIENGLQRLGVYIYNPKKYEKKTYIELDKLTKKQEKYLKTIEGIIDGKDNLI